MEIAWLNGQRLTDTKAIDINDRGFLLGDGVFETLLCQDGKPKFLNPHLDRLRKGTTALRLPVAVHEAFLRDIAYLASREMSAQSATLRITVFRGVGPRGLADPKRYASGNCLVTFGEVSEPLQTANIIVTSRRRLPQHAGSFKSIGSYVENIMARNECRDAGADDGLLTSVSGNISCATAANVFLIAEDGEVVTPPLEDGAMPGVVRGVILDEAAASERRNRGSIHPYEC